MKKVLLVLLALIVNFSLFGQAIKPIAKRVNDVKAGKFTFERKDLFVVDALASKSDVYQKSAKDALVLNLKKEVLREIINAKPMALEMTIPYENSTITVELVKNDIFGGEGNLNVMTDKGQFKIYKPGVYYQGIIKGDNRSVVAFSFFENNVIALASDLKNGNIVLGKAVGSQDYVIYNDAKLTAESGFICETDKLMENQKQQISFDPKTSKAPEETQNCVRVYYEIANKPFVQNGSSVATTTDWITAVHNNIATLYTNDGIKTSLHEIFIWTTADPYTGNYSANLDLFRARRATFNGDLAHLVNYPSTTSVAYLNSLCSDYRYAYSGINMTYNNVPAYSWTIMAMTHEMGHALGSPHTHACAWNGDGTAIDGCGDTAGYGEGCSGPIPAKGTIMSYCHLLSSVGINMALGFGEQPGALIRQTVDSKGCINNDCQTACPVTISGFVAGMPTENGLSGMIVDNVGTEWRYSVVDMAGVVVKSGVTTNKNINIAGLESYKYYKLRIGGNCGSTESYQISQMFLTGTSWCGKVFMDSGGDGDYSDNESFTKTFIPENAGDKMTLTFDEFNLEQGYDFMTVRNGLADSPAFPGATNMSGTTIKGPFVSTHSTGAITVVFSSDGGVVESGWKAILSCANLGVDDVNGKASVSITPNPTNGPIEITSKSKIESVTVYDAEGKMLLNQRLNTQKQTISLANYPKGTYIVNVKTATETVSKKVIRK